ncbi:restriction endonuclease subunit S [Burkholderia sp. Bp9004]|uniref:restriction endonuclease subunit S n=1 Tax=Burkholderia sp. Bp9004 TaxID=2184559 RepID=UPI000F5DFADE|nr:restriction endonuclease subunit S [Burkholderia sp. Bp9004]RQZ60261.1 restriction endonuclease subunit S [Burkholderia sp. Bp9004]
MSLSSYPEYKDSGVAWLGQVPAHWHVDRFKASIASCKNGIWGNEPCGDESDIACVRVADFDRPRLVVNDHIPTLRNVSDKERAGRLLTKGDLLLEKSGGGELQPVGQVVMYNLEMPAVCSNFVAKMSLARNQVPAYWNYVHSAAYSVGVNIGAINQTSGIQNLDQDRYFNERAPFPPSGEQAAIAKFLDNETNKIDTLIAEQEKLLVLLAEKRQATISHVVTRGLNPDVPMKNSGVAWLGEMPAHWDVKKIKYIGQVISGFAFPSASFQESGTRVLKIANIQTGTLDWSDESFLPDDYCESHSEFLIQDGDFVFALTRPIISSGIKAATARIGTEKVLLNQRNALFRPSAICVKEFVYHIFFSSSFKAAFENWIDFTGQQPNISALDICKIYVPLPSLEEQKVIAKFLDCELAKLDSLKTEAQHAIELLEVRRSALIAAAVTGKIDVRNVVQQELAA